MIANSHLTAISRKSLPVPVRWLLNMECLIVGKVLDYGCGKCVKINRRWILSHYLVKGLVNYDPFYAPYEFGPKEVFDTILCTYVICALPPEEELPILRHIQSLLAPNGMAFISVRNDKPKQGHGFSARGTFQRWVELPYLRLLHKNSQARIYLLTAGNKLPE